MPFTPSHAVVALAFTRTPLVPAAIAVGAMTPDLPLFVRTGLPLYGYTHDAAFVPATALVALVLLLVWRCVLRPAAAELSPRWLAGRLPEAWARGAAASARETFASPTGRVTASSLMLLSVSLVLGVLTHIGWDLFTHEGRGGVEAIPALDAMWGPLPGYTWAQHGSSVLGLAILAVWAAVRLCARGVRHVERRVPDMLRLAWWVSLPAVLVVAWGVGLAAYGPISAEWTVAHLAYRVLPAAVGGWGAATLVLAAWVGWRRHARDAARFAEPADPA
ncbi:DUF4184 family protein [Microbacterium sp. NPDC091313]